MAYEKLFEPIKIGPLELKNRYAYAPANCFYEWTGLMTEKEIAYYTARAMGGPGMIIVGAYLSTKFGIPYMHHPFMFCFDITHAPGLMDLAENIQLGGAKAILQLLPVPGSGGGNWKGVQPVAPSPVPYLEPPGWRAGGEKRKNVAAERIPNSIIRGFREAYPIPRAVTLDEIQTVINENAYACRIAALAGWDGIELHMCHTYFVDSFRNPLSNHRTDKYGGSEENRNRFVVEIIEASIRAAKEENRNMVVGARLSCECGEGGYTFEETKRLALQLQELGLDYCHLTAGRGQPGLESGEDGVYLNHSRNLQKLLKIPVITPTVHDPKLAEEAVVEGRTDMVACARPLMADQNLLAR